MNFLHLWSSYFVLLHHRNLYTEWTIELKAMADRIISMRQQLFDALRARGQHFFFSLLFSDALKLISCPSIVA